MPSWSAGLIGFLILSACGRATADLPSPTPSSELVAHNGRFSDTVLLTGTLHALRAENILVPRTPTWQVQIRWMEEDGTRVKTGQKVLEFDNRIFLSDLEDKKLAYARTEKELAQQEAEIAAQALEKTYTVEDRRVAVEKARLDADVPKDLIPLRQYQEKQLALEKARSELAKAEDDVEAYLKGAREDLTQKRIAQQKAGREIGVAERAIEVLTVAAPRDGILIVADHRWEGRKVQVGDMVQVGWPVLQIPDLTAVKVEAVLSDVDDGAVAVGMPATLTLDAHSERTYSGKVVDITPVARETSPQSLRRAFYVTVHLDATDEERMRPGMSVKVEIGRSNRQAAVLAPRAGLDLGGPKPLALLADGTTREIRLGPCNPFECVVEEGLAAGVGLRRASSWR